jgi:hypothetical protein
MAGESGKVWIIEDIKTLLPLHFSGDDLKVKLEL